MPARIPILSIKQPWAWLIVAGHKDIENRTWATRYRGPLLIHAGKQRDKDFDWTWARQVLRAQADKSGVELSPIPDKPTDYWYGGVVGRVVLADCVTASASPWFFGPKGFVLQAPERLPFRPLRGQQGFFYEEPKPAERLLL